MVTISNRFHPRLRITEIFHSLQGETSTVGLPTVFVRLTGCPLRCQYCDTAYAFNGGEMIDLPAVLEQVASYDARYVTVTGGEPLAQTGVSAAAEGAVRCGYDTSLETSGALDIGGVDPRVARIVDLKTPGSKEVAPQPVAEHRAADATRSGEVRHLRRQRLCVGARRDRRARSAGERLAKYCSRRATRNCRPLELAEWILRDRLRVRMQIQLHKVLWGNEPRPMTAAAAPRHRAAVGGTRFRNDAGDSNGRRNLALCVVVPVRTAPRGGTRRCGARSKGTRRV